MPTDPPHTGPWPEKVSANLATLLSPQSELVLTPIHEIKGQTSPSLMALPSEKQTVLGQEAPPRTANTELQTTAHRTFISQRENKTSYYGR